MTPFLLGIAGASGSGKTTLAHVLKGSDCTPEACVLSMDHYYHGLPENVAPDNYNFDHPSAMDIDRLAADLTVLKRGQSVYIPQYDFIIHRRCAEGILFSPAPLIIVEGIMLYISKPLRELFDFRIYLDVPDNLCLQRRIVRDMTERGRSEESVRKQIIHQVQPMFRRFVLPTRNFADLILTPPELNNPKFNNYISSLWKKITESFQDPEM